MCRISALLHSSGLPEREVAVVAAGHIVSGISRDGVRTEPAKDKVLARPGGNRVVA